MYSGSFWISTLKDNVRWFSFWYENLPARFMWRESYPTEKFKSYKFGLKILPHKLHIQEHFLTLGILNYSISEIIKPIIGEAHTKFNLVAADNILKILLADINLWVSICAYKPLFNTNVWETYYQQHKWNVIFWCGHVHNTLK